MGEGRRQERAEERLPNLLLVPVAKPSNHLVKNNVLRVRFVIDFTSWHPINFRPTLTVS